MTLFYPQYWVFGDIRYPWVSCLSCPRLAHWPVRTLGATTWGSLNSTARRYSNGSFKGVQQELSRQVLWDKKYGAPRKKLKTDEVYKNGPMEMWSLNSQQLHWFFDIFLSCKGLGWWFSSARFRKCFGLFRGCPGCRLKGWTPRTPLSYQPS